VSFYGGAGRGGGLFNWGEDGDALVTFAHTSVAPNNVVNSNHARYGGGIYNLAGSGISSVSLQPITVVSHNIASVTGGGVDNCQPVDFSAVGTVFILNSPNNIVNACD
jgi:hypothetical protein